MYLHLNNNARLSGNGAYRIRFVRVDMHCLCVAVRYAAYNISENSFSLGCFKLYPYNVLVLYSKLRCVSLCEVDMTLCNDNSFGKLDLSAGTHKLACARARCVSALSYGSCYTDRTRIRCGKLDLICLSARSEYRYSRERFLRSYDLNSFLAGKLTRLGKIFFLCKSVPLAEKNLESLGKKSRFFPLFLLIIRLSPRQFSEGIFLIRCALKDSVLCFCRRLFSYFRYRSRILSPC